MTVGALGDLSVYTNKKTTMVQDITGWQYTWDTVISTDAAEIASHKDYITFDKGNIILGDSASASKLKLTKDSIQFKGTSDTAIKPDSDATAWITGPIMSTPVSISSINGLTIRQNGIYIYGSTASKPIKPASYTAAVIGGRNGLNVRAKMRIDSNGFTDTDIKNIVNNDTCAIMASIKITFS